MPPTTTRTTRVQPTKPSVRRASYLPPTFSIPQVKQPGTRTASPTLDPKAALAGSAFKFQPMDLRISPAILGAFRDKKSPLARLLDNPPSLRGEATQFSDGRKIRIVLALVRDVVGNAAGGILVELRRKDDNRLLDFTRTNDRGIAVLRMPMKESFTGDIPASVVQVLGVDLNEVLDVAFDGDAQSSLAEFILPALPSVGSGRAEDPFERIPADFTPELCDEVSRILGTWEDPLMENLGEPTDFRSRRTKLIKRFVVPRIGEEKDEFGGPKRYLVHMRQEWMFLGYTLGELQEVESLDPGAVIDETARTVSRTTNRVARSATDQLREAVQTAQNTLSRASSIDTLVDVATQLHSHTDTGTTVSAGASGWGFGIPGLFGIGEVGAEAGVETFVDTTLLTHATTRTSTDTSLQVNSMLRAAQSEVNRVVRTATSTVRSLTHVVNTATDQVSPLLSRVTNLLRWAVYENYAVCTRVEDVVELKAVRVVEEAEDGDLFTAEEVVEYQRFFERRLLDPYLRRHFRALRRAVDLRNNADQPVTGIGFTVDYNAVWCGADLRISVGGEDLVVPLVPGGRRTGGFIHFPTPIPEEELDQAEMELTFRSDRCENVPNVPFVDLAEMVRNAASVEVNRVQVRYQSAPGANLRDAERVTGFRVTNDAPSDNLELPLDVPEPHVFPETNPLYLHVNRNPTYYMGLLLQAALRIPSLREDARQLRALGTDLEAVFRLPIVGFEGDHVLVVGDVQDGDAFAEKLRQDIGAGTLVQLAAPGAYSEALQGLLQLTDAAGRIHPTLEPPLPPQMPPLALVDVLGNTLQLVDSEGNPVTGISNAVTGTTSGATGGSTGTGGTDSGGLTEDLPVP